MFIYSAGRHKSETFNSNKNLAKEQTCTFVGNLNTAKVCEAFRERLIKNGRRVTRGIE